jgi:hypothetical protein
MTVTIDSQALSVEELGFHTVGDVLAHVKTQNRLVTHVLIDGCAPDLAAVNALRQRPILGHTIYIETAEPSRVALDVLDELAVQMEQAEQMRAAVVNHLASGETSAAMGKLSGCFTIWQSAQQAIEQIGQLLRVDLDRITLEQGTLTDALSAFADQLRTIRSALEDRDYVVLSDTLEYEIGATIRLWNSALEQFRAIVA